MSKRRTPRARRARMTSAASKSTLVGEVPATDQSNTQPPAPRIGSLHDVDAIRREMSRVYREARRGTLDTREAGRLVYILGEIRKCYEVSVLERRLAALENPHG